MGCGGSVRGRPIGAGIGGAGSGDNAVQQQSLVTCNLLARLSGRYPSPSINCLLPGWAGLGSAEYSCSRNTKGISKPYWRRHKLIPSAAASPKELSNKRLRLHLPGFQFPSHWAGPAGPPGRLATGQDGRNAPGLTVVVSSLRESNCTPISPNVSSR